MLTPKVAKLIFAQRIFEHSVIQNHCIAIRCELLYKRHLFGKPFSFKSRSIDLKRIVKPVITANWIVNGIFSAPYILLYVIRKGDIF